MGLLGKSSRRETPAAESTANTGIDPEKGAIQLDKNSPDGAVAAPVRPQIDPIIEKRVVRKHDKNLTPLVAALFLLAFLDRSNIGNAKIAGMQKDLDLGVGNRYQWLLTIFYISYILFQPATLCWKIFPPHIWASVTVLGWGLFASCQASTQSWSGMMALRFLLGAVEAAFGPGIPYLLSFFYLRKELGLRVGLFFSAAPLANTFAGALAYGITSGHSKFANWRLLFLVEGLPTLLMVPVAFWFIPDTPARARYLNEEEKAVAEARGVKQVGEGNRVGGLHLNEVGQCLKDPIAWFTAFMYFSCNVSYSSLPVFLPTILTEMGFSAISAQGLTAPPYFLSFLITIATPYIADRTQQRGIMIMTLSLIGAIGYVLLATASSVGVRYFGVWLAAAGIFPAIGNIIVWVLNNQGTDARRGTGIALLNLIGQCGPLLGTNVYPTKDAPRYVKGFVICAAFMFLNALLALGLRTLLAYENRKLDRRYGTREVFLAERERARKEGQEEDVLAEENYGPLFRYAL